MRILTCFFPAPSDIMVIQSKEVHAMTVRERILALKLLEKQEQNPDYAKRIGIQVCVSKKDPENKEEHHV